MAVIRDMLVRSNRMKSMCGSVYLAISFFVITIGFFISPNLSADAAFQFHTIDKQQGLVSSVVYDIAQDKEGFMWFATEDGLQKYDGFEFTSYRHNRLDENSISNNFVRSILIDSKGRIWIGTGKGINLYQKKSNSFVRFNNVSNEDEGKQWDEILDLYETEDGTIWIGSSNGLSYLQEGSSGFINYSKRKVRSIYEDKYKQLWIGTLGAGLFVFDRMTHEFFSLNEQKTKVEASGTKIQNVIDIKQDSFGRVLVATWGQGVFEIARGTRTVRKFDIELPSLFVKSIHQDRQGQLWFGTQQGLLVVDSLGDKSRVILADETNVISPNSDNIFKIFQGEDGMIWIGTYGGGISQHNPASRKFQSYGLSKDKKSGLVDPVIFSMAENSQGDIWLGSETGKMSLFQPQSQQFTHYNLQLKNTRFHGQITAIYQIDENEVLLGTEMGLFTYWLKSGVMSRYLINGAKPDFDDDSVSLIFKDESNRIWVGFGALGLVRLGVSDAPDGKPLSVDISSPQVMLETSKNSFLVGSKNDGIYDIRVEPKEIFKKRQENTARLNVLDLAFDWKGRLWIATWSEGIKVSLENGKFYSLDEGSGLPNNTVYKILPDPGSRKMWATSNVGMVAVVPEDFSVVRYGFYDGLQGDEFNRPGLISKNGFMYFGGINGFNRFYPNIVESKTSIREPIITDLWVANQKLSTVKRHKSQDPSLVNLLSAVELDFDQMPFSIGFTSPQFIKPADLEFRYRLVGLDKRWIISDASSRKATYTNLDAGKYTFELQARNINDEWRDKVVKKEILILPPWWLTAFAKLTYFLAASSVLLYILYLTQQRRQSEMASLIMREKSEERLRLSLWGGGNELWDWDIVTGEISRSNEDRSIDIDCPTLAENLAELDSYIHKFDVDRVKSQLRDHLNGVTGSFDSTYRIKDGALGWRWIQDRAKVVERDNKGSPVRMSGTQKDISEMQHKNEEIERLGQAFKNTSDGVWIRDSEWRLIEVNPSFEKITEFTFEEKQGEELWFPEVGEQSTNIIQRVRLSLLEKGHWQGEIWAERKNKDPFPQKLTIDTVLDDKGYVSYYVGVFSDITFRKRAEEEFRKLANFDSLTGLPNRACLYDRLNQTIDKTRIRKERFALFIVDIDNFKRINDSMGHSVGDTLIAEVAQRLTHCNRDGDTVARVGGDEFVIIRDDIYSSTEVASFAELMLKELNSPIFAKGQKLSLNYSIGITLSPDDGTTAEKLLRNADTAMYEAKKDIQNSYHFFSVDLNKKARKRLSLENELRQAIEFDLIGLVYQPKVNMQTGLVEGMEALARWNHPKLGFISPEEFVTLAEETGLILRLGAQILRKAIVQAKEWVDLGMMKGRMSVNLSTHQFLHQDLTNQVKSMLKELALESKYLELELTETACMQDIDKTIEHMKSLRKIGVSMALDDFGTGYSSLGQLQTLPLDTLKVDKSFINNIENSDQEVSVVKAIIDIARSLNLEVVIEGVESRKQCDRLWQCRANIIQGYFFSKPVSGQLMTKLLDKKWEQSTYLSKISDNVRTLG